MPTGAKDRKRVTVYSLAASVKNLEGSVASLGVSIEDLARMVQEGFLEVGNRLTRVEIGVEGLQKDMAEVKAALPTFVPMSMHEQLKKRVAVVEEKVGA